MTLAVSKSITRGLKRYQIIAVLGFALATALSTQVRGQGPSDTTEALFANTQIFASHPDLQFYADQARRAEDIARQLASAANGQCANRWRHPGFYTLSLSDVPKSLRVHDLARITEIPTVTNVTDPALQGKIAIGDQLLGVNNTLVPATSFDLQAQMALGKIRILRGGRVLNIYHDWTPACYRPITITDGFEVAARTTPGSIDMSAGLFRFVRSDSELAFGIAHELSHFMLNHSARLSRARRKGRLSQSMKRRLETDADQAAVFLLIKAGFDPEAGVRFLNRTSVVRDIPLFGLSSHPTRRKRITTMRQTIAWANNNPQRVREEHIADLLADMADDMDRSR